MPINRPAVEALVAALRSGEFQQGRHLLVATTLESGQPVTKYCCLGVACVVAGRLGLSVTATQTGFSTNGSDFSSVALPVGVMQFYGFTDPNPFIEPRPGSSPVVEASTANDSLRLDFNAIADAFERTYLHTERTYLHTEE